MKVLSGSDPKPQEARFGSDSKPLHTCPPAGLGFGSGGTGEQMDVLTGPVRAGGPVRSGSTGLHQQVSDKQTNPVPILEQVSRSRYRHTHATLVRDSGPPDVTVPLRGLGPCRVPVLPSGADSSRC